MKFAYTKAQEQIVHQILDGLQQKKDLFVYAATGAGKTEITYEAICMYLLPAAVLPADARLTCLLQDSIRSIFIRDFSAAFQDAADCLFSVLIS